MTSRSTSGNICDFEDICGTRGRPPLNSKDEEVMVQSFFTPFGQSSRDDQSRHSQRGDLAARAGAHYPDNQELLDYDYPAVPQKVTVMTRDAADMDPRPMSRKASSRFQPSPHGNRSAPPSKRDFDVPMNIQYPTKPRMYNAQHLNQMPQEERPHHPNGRHEEESTIFGDMKSANTILDEASNVKTPPRVRNHYNNRRKQQPQQQQQQQHHQQRHAEYTDEDDSAMLGGLQFVSETGTVNPLFPINESSQQGSHASMYSYSVDSASHRSGSPTPPSPFEDLPQDEYNVTLAAMDEYSRTSSPSMFGNLKHRLPSTKRAANFAVLEHRRSRCLRGFAILTLLLAISIGVVAYMEIIDGQQNVTYTNTGSGTDPSEAGKANGGPKEEDPPTPSVPNRPPAEVEMLKASEAYDILGPQVQDPALLLDPETPQGKAFDRIFAETTNSGRDDPRDGPGGRLLFELKAMVVGRRELAYSEQRIVQRFALMVLYFATGGEDTWFNNLGWDVFEGNECEWYGVECFNRDRIATTIALSQNGLVGKVPSEICLLSNVQFLGLDQNELSGKVPECIATKMDQLTEIDVHQNEFDSELPNAFFLSSSLRTMDFSENQFTGVIDVPSMDTEKKGFRSFGRFKTIKLNDNNLSGEIDSAFMFFTGLERLLLHNNNLMGGIDVMCIHPLREFTADCTKVTCTCCSKCY